MKKIGKVIEVFSAKKEDKKSLPRPRVKKLELIKDYGIKDDKFAGKDFDKTVMIVGLKSYKLAKENNIKLEYGSLGENIFLDFDPHTYEVGDILIMNEAKIQITQVCTVCSHLSHFDKKLPKLLKNHRGLYCKILENGIITKNTDVLIRS